MKTSGMVLWLWLALAGWCAAQVQVQILLDQEQFLRSESLPVKLRVINSSGQTLHLGREPEWLVFEIRDADGRDLRRLDKIPLADPFDLEASMVASLSIDLMPYYDLSKVGKYSLRVLLKVRQLNQAFASVPQSFDIVSGTKLWEREFGVPAAGVPEVRKYALQQANFLKELRLYVRLTDPSESKVFRVLSLGTLISFSKPEAQLDRSSNLHVLFQHGPRTFLYQVITPAAEIILRQTYDYAGNSRPVLRFDDEQGLHVVGGRRRVVLSDLPPPSESYLAPPAPEPAPTNPPPKTPKSSKKTSK